MISISKRRLASLATASAMVATLAVAAVPGAAFAAKPPTRRHLTRGQQRLQQRSSRSPLIPGTGDHRRPGDVRRDARRLRGHGTKPAS